MLITVCLHCVAKHHCAHLAAAAGVDRNVLVWDVRQPKTQIGRWSNAHKHEVTHLTLLPHAPTHAVVGGVDYEVGR